MSHPKRKRTKIDFDVLDGTKFPTAELGDSSVERAMHNLVQLSSAQIESLGDSAEKKKRKKDAEPAVKGLKVSKPKETKDPKVGKPLDDSSAALVAEEVMALHAEVDLAHEPVNIRWEDVQTTLQQSHPHLSIDDQMLYYGVTLHDGKGRGGGIDWKAVAEHMGNKLTPNQYRVQWFNTLKPALAGARVGNWSADEERLLKEGMELYHNKGKGGSINWVKISQHMGGTRSAEQCRMHWRKDQRPKTDTRAGAWTPEENALLHEAVSLYNGSGLGGGVDWVSVVAHMGNIRSIEQCRMHWRQESKPQSLPAITGPWSDEELRMLKEAAEAYAGKGMGGGIDWMGVVAALGHTRSSEQCRMRYRQMVKKFPETAKHGPWLPEEDQALREGVAEFQGKGMGGGIDWLRVVERMGNKRTPEQARMRWRQAVKPHAEGAKGHTWTAEEESLLKLAVEANMSEETGEINWKKVVDDVGGVFTMKQCARRWATMQRRAEGLPVPWSQEEDDLLREAVTLYSIGKNGAINWAKVMEHINTTRPLEVCRNRWRQTLRPIPEQEMWSSEEDALLREAVEMYEGQGKQGKINWVKVAEHMGGNRTVVNLSNRWHKVLKPILESLEWEHVPADLNPRQMTQQQPEIVDMDAIVLDSTTI